MNSINLKKLYLFLLFFSLFSCKEYSKKVDVKEINKHQMVDSNTFSCGDFIMYRYIGTSTEDERSINRLKVYLNGEYFRALKSSDVNLALPLDTIYINIIIESFENGTHLNNDCSDLFYVNEKKPIVYKPVSGVIKIHVTDNKIETWHVELENALFTSESLKKIRINKERINCINEHLIGG